MNRVPLKDIPQLNLVAGEEISLSLDQLESLIDFYFELKENRDDNNEEMILWLKTLINIQLSAYAGYRYVMFKYSRDSFFIVHPPTKYRPEGYLIYSRTDTSMRNSSELFYFSSPEQIQEKIPNYIENIEDAFRLLESIDQNYNAFISKDIDGYNVWYLGKDSHGLTNWRDKNLSKIISQMMAHYFENKNRRQSND